MGNPWILTERQKVIDLWLRCAVNYYGAITPRAFLVLFNRYNKPKLLKDELLKYTYKLNRQIDKNYYIYTNYIVNREVNRQKIDEIIYHQSGKKFYYATDNELLIYENPEYYQPTDETKALIDYLKYKYNIDFIIADGFARKLTILSRTEATVQEQTALIDQFKIPLKDIKEADIFLGYMMNVMNTTRKWANCGHTPAELYDGHLS